MYYTINKSKLNSNEIIKFNTVFSIGNLAKINNCRISYPDFLNYEEYDFSSNMVYIKSLINKMDFRIWCSNYDADSYILLCYFCNYFKNQDYNLFVVYSDEYNKDYNSPAMMNEQELELATKKEYKLSQEEKIILSDQWIDIENQDCDLRIMRQKKVKLVKYNYFDDAITDELLQLGTCKVSKLVGILLSKYDHLNDSIYVLLIDRLIKIGKIKLIKPNSKRYFDSIISL